MLDLIWQKGYVFTPRILGWKEGRAKEFIEGDGKLLPYKLDLNALEPHKYDCYFAPLTFNKDRRQGVYANDASVLWADLDEVDPRTLAGILKPSIAWKSSKNRYQGLWLLDSILEPKELEEYNRLLTYKIGADKSGWDLTQLLRIPGTYNHKYGKPQKVELLWKDIKDKNFDELAKLLREPVPAEITSTVGTDFKKLLNPYPVTAKAIKLLETTETPPVGERSERLWELEKSLIEAKVPVSIILGILKSSVWNKFSDRRDGDKQLLNEIVKAESEHYSKVAMSEPEPKASPLISFTTMMLKDVRNPEWLVESFVQQASVGVCAGEPKTMKSTLMLDMAVSVASGTLFMNKYPTKSVPTLYIQEENSEADIKDRITRMAYAKGVIEETELGYDLLPIPLYLMNNTGLNLLLEADRAQLEQTIKDNDIKLAVLDPWYMLASGTDENSVKEISPLLKFFTGIRNKYGCAIMLVHHFKKGEANRGGQRMRGSSVFHAWVECGIYTELTKNTPGDIKVEREFRSFPSHKGLHIVFNYTGDIGYSVRVLTDDYIELILPSATLPARSSATGGLPI